MGIFSELAQTGWLMLGAFAGFVYAYPMHDESYEGFCVFLGMIPAGMGCVLGNLWERS